jgi:hypothetical protein
MNANNGHAVVKSPAKKAPAKSAGKSVARRVEELEAAVATMQKLVSQMSQVLGGMVENQAVQQAMPAVEQQLRQGIKQRLAEQGFDALLNPQAPAQG